MVIEKVELTVTAGREAEFLQFLRDSRAAYEGLPGCQSLKFGRGVENPAKLILLASWDSVEAHQAAKTAPAFISFSKQLAGFLAGRPTAEHFAM